MRPTPQVGPDELMGMLKEALSPIEIHQPGCLHLQHLHEPIPAYACQDDSELVREAERPAAGPPSP